MRIPPLRTAGILTLTAGLVVGIRACTDSGPTLNLYVANNGAIQMYNATTGAPKSGFSSPTGPRYNAHGLALSGNTLYVSESYAVRSYNATTGATIATFTTPRGLEQAGCLAVLGNRLYIATWGTGLEGKGMVGVYDATTGAPIQANLISGIYQPYGVAVSGDRLYVSNYSSGTVSVYDATTGAVIQASLISGLNLPTGLAISGTHLYVACHTIGTVGEFDATTGAPINAKLISGLRSTCALTLSGNYLFVVNRGYNSSLPEVAESVEKYDATTGARIRRFRPLGGLSFPSGVAISEAAP